MEELRRTINNSFCIRLERHKVSFSNCKYSLDRVASSKYHVLDRNNYLHLIQHIFPTSKLEVQRFLEQSCHTILRLQSLLIRVG